MLESYTKAPFPYYGGKRQAAPVVWALLGDVAHYVEPFCGTLSVLLERPHPCNRPYYSETVNDANGLLINAWRSIQWQPEATAEACSWPVSEVCKHARQAALLQWQQSGILDLLAGSPEWCDPQMGGWWLYSVCCQIGAFHGDGPWSADPVTGRLVKRGVQPGVTRNLPHLSNNGQGVHHAGLREPGVSRDLPHLSDNGQGVHRPQLREPGVGEEPEFHPLTMPELRRWFRWLSARLRHVRLVHGDWSRVCTEGARLTLNVRQGHGPCGVFCLHPDTLVRLENEQLLPLWQVQPGEKLHGGRTVLRVMTRPYQGRMLRLAIQGLPLHLRLTPEHRVPRIPGRKKGRQDSRTDAELWQKRELVAAEHLQPGDYVLVPLGGKEQTAPWYWHPELRPHGTRQNPATFTPTTGLWRLLGYYAAEGHITWKNQRPYSVALTFGVHEDATYVQDASTLFREIFGITPTRRHPHASVTVLHVGSTVVARFFAHYVRGDAVSKTLHPDLMTAPMHGQEALLQGWLRGDGGLWLDTRSRAKLTGTTASHALAWQMYTIALRCGLKPSWKFRQRNVDVYFASEDARRLGWDVPAKAFRSTRRIINNHLLTRIRTITTDEYAGDVYDLDVDGDDLFTAPFVLVHNCDPPYAPGEREKTLYMQDSDVTEAVRAWCVKAGQDPRTRIVLAGYDTEHTALEAHGWTVHEWYTAGFLRGGYGNIDGTSQQQRERLWASPACLTQETAQLNMFGGFSHAP